MEGDESELNPSSPANAGTHNRLHLDLTGKVRQLACNFASVQGSEVMGPGVRDDDGGAMSPHLRAGVIAAATVLIADQASKLWLLFAFDIAGRGAVRVTPFFDLVLAWNTGISYGWFQTESTAGQAFLLAFKAAAVIVLAIWMARSQTRLATLALGLIIGGAIGNAIDRLAYGAVVDFAH